MELKDFLIELSLISEEKEELNFCYSEYHKQLGLYDNFPILLSEEPKEVFADFLASKDSEDFFSHKYLIKESKYGYGDGVFGIFNYSLGTIIVQILGLNWYKNNFPPYSLIGYGCSCDQKHAAVQIKNFKTVIMLHPYQDEKIKGVHDLKVMATVINEVSNYVQKKRLALCMTKTARYGNSKIEDVSRIVYYYPPSV